MGAYVLAGAFLQPVPRTGRPGSGRDSCAATGREALIQINVK
jgi:hypothetical protein